MHSQKLVCNFIDLLYAVIKSCVWLGCSVEIVFVLLVVFISCVKKNNKTEGNEKFVKVKAIFNKGIQSNIVLRGFYNI